MASETIHISAKEAAKILGVSVTTLYAYVSRGLLSSQPGSDARSRRYLRAEVGALKAKREARRDPSTASTKALDFGEPVLESAISLIADGRYFYRGLDAVSLAQSRRFEEVVRWLWLGDWQKPLAWQPWRTGVPREWKATLAPFAAGGQADAFGALMRLASAHDGAGYLLTAEGVVRTGTRILALLTSYAAGGRQLAGDLATTLQKAWLPDRPETVPFFNTVLILCADHELNISSFSARCVASAGSTPYDVVNAGVCALRGFRHGGEALRVARFIAEFRVGNHSSASLLRGEVRRILADRLQMGQLVAGFGHHLYPKGDPRFVCLAQWFHEYLPHSPMRQRLMAIAEETENLLGLKPTLDFGLVMACLVLGLDDEKAWVLFALGRAAGWLAHGLEEYGRAKLIRPRSRYIGAEPVMGNHIA